MVPPAGRPTDSTNHDRRIAGPARRLCPRLEHPPTAPLPRPAHPHAAYLARPKATAAPGSPAAAPEARVRRDCIDTSGVVTLRYDGRLHHIGIGRTHARTSVLLLIDDRDIRVINATTGELLRHLTLDPTRDYQPTGKPKTKKPGP